jgi:C4-dicarboxylate transporter, DctQ subunit
MGLRFHRFLKEYRLRGEEPCPFPKAEGGNDGERLSPSIIKEGGRFMNLFWRVFDGVSEAMVGLAGVILVFICGAVCYTIGMRFFFSRTTIWLIQTTEYALLWIVFLATTWLLKEGGHITTDIIYGALGPKTKRVLDLILFALSAVACAVCFYFAATYTYQCVSKGVTDVRAVTVPKASIFVIIPIGFLMLTVQFLRMAWHRLIDAKGGR